MKYMLLLNYAGGEGCNVPMNEWPPEDITAHIEFQHRMNQELIESGELVDMQGLSGPELAKTVINDQLKALTGKALKPATIDRAFSEITITEDPIASSLKESATHAVATGLVKEADLKGIYDLTILDELLGRTVDDAGLGS